MRKWATILILSFIGIVVVIAFSFKLAPPEIQKCEQKTNSTDRDNCYSDEAFYTREHNYCENIRSQNIRDDCYYSIAVDTRRKSLCDKISDEEVRLDCLTVTR